MKKLAQHGLIALAITAGSLSFSSTAHAWGCTAADSEGATGWSTNYPTKKKAARRAVNECNNQSNTGDCYATECNIDW